MREAAAQPNCFDSSFFFFQNYPNQRIVVYTTVGSPKTDEPGRGKAVADVRVTCITKPHPQSPHEHITHLGNPQVGWKWTREEVIQSIDAKTNTFFVVDPYTGKRSDVGVVRPAGRAAYVRTHADGDWNDNLLSLNQCTL
jgi:hypothetical protein